MVRGEKALLAAVFFMGFQAAVVQVILIRELLAVLRGNELVIGVFFGAWFLGIFAGAAASSRVSRSSWRSALFLSCAALPPVAALAVYGSHCAPMAAGALPGTLMSHSMEYVLALAASLPVSVPVGIFFPPAVSLLSEIAGKARGALVFSVESIGSFTGGVLFSFVLIDRAVPIAILLVLMAAGLVLLSRKPAALVCAILIAAASFFGDRAERAFFSAIWPATHAGTLVRCERSLKQLICLERNGEQWAVYSNGTVLYALPDHYESRALFHLAESFRKGKKRVLLFGVPPSALMCNLRRLGASVTCVEPDGRLWNIGRSIYSQAGDGGRPCLPGVFFERDMVHHLGRDSLRYDLILSVPHAPENLQMNRFFTVEYFKKCRELLAPGGTMIASMQGFSNYMSPVRRNYLASIYKSFKAAFPDCIVTSGDPAYLIGGKEGPPIGGSVDEHLAEYQARFSRLPSGTLDDQLMSSFSADELRAFFEKTQREYFNRVMDPLLPGVDFNSDARPGGYWKYLLFSLFRDGSSAMAAVERFNLIIAGGLCLFACSLLFLRRRRGALQFHNGAVMSCAGFAGMASMIALIVTYQQEQGVVYYRIALVSGVFMLGLAAGSALFGRIASWRGYLPPILLLASQGVIWAYSAFRFEALFWTSLTAVSFAAGGFFPALFGTSPPGEMLASSSVLDAFDHLGALFGSVASTLVIIPAVGTGGVIAVNCALAFLAVISNRARNGALTAAAGGA